MADSHNVKGTRSPGETSGMRLFFAATHSRGRLFDVVLLTLILLSVLTVILESVPSLRAAHGSYLKIAEWVFTCVFTCWSPAPRKRVCDAMHSVSVHAPPPSER
jgi:hypothetical protein